MRVQTKRIKKIWTQGDDEIKYHLSKTKGPLEVSILRNS